MPPILAQLGDIATRLRRFYRPAGSLAVGVSNEVSNHVIIANLDQVPYADEPYHFVVDLLSTSDAVHLPSVGLQARAAGGSETAVVLDAIWVYGGAAGFTASVNIERNVLYSTFGADFSITPQAPFVLSTPSFPSTTVTPQLCAAIAATTPSLSGLPSSTSLFNFPVGITPAVAQVTLPEPIVLFSGNPALGGAPVGDVVQVISSLNNQGIAVAFWGREYRLLQGAP